jgi:carbon-monoxide dehydrogenase large subunit
VCAFVLGIPEHKMRVIAPDVGGGFGSKIFLYGEETALVMASKLVGRPVKWTAERSESFLSDAHGRDHVTKAELALDAQGRFLAMRVKTTANLGAYLSTFASSVPTILYATLLAGQYATPKIHCEVTGVFTSTAPVDAYRGAGRPEATYVVERLVETAARELGIDPAEIRRRNFIRQFPYATPVGLTYDTGDYEATLDQVQELADLAGYAARKAVSESRGLKRGIGYSCYIEACGLAPSNIAGALGARAGLFEAGEVRVHPTGKVTVFTGSHSHGQGHETTFAQVVADRLGIALDDVDIVHGDTGRVPFGMGTYGSRSLAVGGTAIVKAIDKVIAKGKKIAAHLLEAAEESTSSSRAAQFKVAGTDKRQGLRRGLAGRLRAAQLPAGEARARPQRERLLRPDQLHLPGRQLHLRGRGRPGHRQAAHRALQRGGRLRQRHQPDDRRGPGARRHGAGPGPGAAGARRVRPDSGQLLTGSYMDYAMPRADDLPSFTVRTAKGTPCTHNPLGVKGCGEAGAIGSPPAVINAICDALGVKDVPMPASPYTVWKRRTAEPEMAGDYLMQAFTYSRPASSWPMPPPTRGAKLIAGGQSLLPSMKLGLAAPDPLVDLQPSPRLEGITVENEATVHIGAMTTTPGGRQRRRAGPSPRWPMLAGNIGDRQVRNRGTIGGSLANNDPAACYPAGRARPGRHGAHQHAAPSPPTTSSRACTTTALIPASSSPR